MSVIIFIIILSILVFVHEAGHFLAAKAFGIRVDEFGLGYPPRAKKLFHWKGTEFTLNWLPFGGFVKIFGENPDDESAHDPKSFVNKNRFAQAVVLVSGVVGNFLIAGVFLALGFMIGMPAPTSLDLPVTDPRTTITQVLPNSPAESAGLKSGDQIFSITRGERAAELTPEGVSNFVSESALPVQITVKRGNDTVTKSVTPAEGIVADRMAVGFGLDTIGTVKLGFGRAIVEGFKSTVVLTGLTAKALGHFLKDAFVGQADFSTVTGPVGIVGMVGDEVALGFVYLLSFAAMISINLSIINLVPFPALDGGRLLFVVIEAIIRRPIPHKVANALNTVGFALLILLMILVTVRDIRNIF